MHTEWDAHNCKTQNKATKYITQRCGKATKNEPDKIANEVHVIKIAVCILRINHECYKRQTTTGRGMLFKRLLHPEQLNKAIQHKSATQRKPDAYATAGLNIIACIINVY